MRERGKPIVLDGGMGRELKRRGAPVDDILWSARPLIEAPETVVEAHLAFIAAGADVITTNNYAVVPGKLAPLGLGARVEELTRLATALAAEAVRRSGRPVRVAGSLPPLAGSFRPDLVPDQGELARDYGRLAETLAPHVDVIICETMSLAREARAAAEAAARTGLGVWVSWTLADLPSPKRSPPGHSVPGVGFAQAGGRTAARAGDEAPRLASGETLDEALAALDGVDVEAFLFNCCAPERIAAAIPRLRPKTKKMIGGYANAFQPMPADWKLGKSGFRGLRDDLGVAAYARFAERWIGDGADIVGGCCGIGPEHIGALRELVDRGAPPAGPASAQ